MSQARNGILTALEKRAMANDQIADWLIKDPHCMDNNPLKEKVYKIVLEYFADKIEESKRGDGSYNNRMTIELFNLIDCYEEADEEKKQEYAKEIAYFMLQTQENWLKIIPDEIKEVTFNIIAEYLEKQSS